MARAIDIADFIIQESNRLEHPITNLELQKYMYFCHARSLLDTGQPLIDDENFEKRRYGPVSPTVYSTYKKYGVDRIFTSDTHVGLNTETWELETEEFDEEILNPIEINVIREVVRKLIYFDAFQLVEEPQRHPSWVNMQEDILNGNREIMYTNEEITSDFQRNKDFRIWETT